MGVESGGDVAVEVSAASPVASEVVLDSAQPGEGPAPDAAQQRLLRDRARRTLELAKHVLASREPTDDADGPALAAQLFRQSAYWSLVARSGGRETPDAGQVFAQRGDELRSRLGGRAADVFETLVTFDFVTFAQRSPEQLHATAADLERLASDLLVAGQRSTWAEQRSQTWAVSLAFLGLGALLFALTAVAMGMLSKPNLAQGKPWKTSSVFAQCDPIGKRCGGVATAVLFHTNEEENPWFEYDLGGPQQFSSVTILNRSDAVQERAVPMVLEVSNDKKTYKELARRKEVFDVWEPSFPPQRARYVRVRVARRSFLHLDGVLIHP
jgi:hypothetical protein